MEPFPFDQNRSDLHQLEDDGWSPWPTNTNTDPFSDNVVMLGGGDGGDGSTSARPDRSLYISRLDLINVVVGRAHVNFTPGNLDRAIQIMKSKQQWKYITSRIGTSSRLRPSNNTSTTGNAMVEMQQGDDSQLAENLARRVVEFAQDTGLVIPSETSSSGSSTTTASATPSSQNKKGSRYEMDGSGWQWLPFLTREYKFAARTQEQLEVHLVECQLHFKRGSPRLNGSVQIVTGLAQDLAAAAFAPEDHVLGVLSRRSFTESISRLAGNGDLPYHHHLSDNLDDDYQSGLPLRAGGRGVAVAPQHPCRLPMSHDPRDPKGRKLETTLPGKFSHAAATTTTDNPFSASNIDNSKHHLPRHSPEGDDWDGDIAHLTERVAMPQTKGMFGNRNDQQGTKNKKNRGTQVPRPLSFSTANATNGTETHTERNDDDVDDDVVVGDDGPLIKDMAKLSIANIISASDENWGAIYSRGRPKDAKHASQSLAHLDLIRKLTVDKIDGIVRKG